MAECVELLKQLDIPPPKSLFFTQSFVCMRRIHAFEHVALVTKVFDDVQQPSRAFENCN